MPIRNASSKFLLAAGALSAALAFQSFRPCSPDRPCPREAEASTPPRGREVTASYYGEGFEGKRTANGERFSKSAMTAAHKSYPFGTKLRVTHPDSGKSVIVRVNDRGPYKKRRELDLSRGAAEKLGMTKEGTARVKIEVVSLGDRTTRG